MQEPSTDIIRIEDLQVDCLIGVYDWEREIAQTVSLTIDMPTDIRRAAATDDLQFALDYKAVSKSIIARVGQSRFQLVESLIEAVARHCLRDFGLPWVRVRLEKPGALRGARTVAIEILRRAGE